MSKLIEISLNKLKEKKIKNAELDLRIILTHSSFSKKQIFLNNFDIKDINLKLFTKNLNRRLNNEPISKIINKKYFWKNQFYVNKNVLDPRPETELIIEESLNLFKNSKKLKILDIGVGSGCLSVSLSQEFKNAEIIGIDVSKEVIKVAKKNILLNKCEEKIKLKYQELSDIDEKFNLIVSNPPYLSKFEFDNCEVDVKKYEPKLALIGGEDGLEFYRKFAKYVPKVMNKGSFFICEIGANQLKPCIDIFANSNLKLIKIRKDLQNIDRTLIFTNIS